MEKAFGRDAKESFRKFNGIKYEFMILKKTHNTGQGCDYSCLSIAFAFQI